MRNGIRISPSGCLLVVTLAVLPFFASCEHTAVLKLNPTGVASVTLNPAAVTRGESSTCTVTLNGPAPAGGAVVALYSSDPSAATVPNSVTVPAGSTTATFTVATVMGTMQATPIISAIYNGTATAQLTVNPAPPPTLTSISLTRGYQNQSYTVTLTGTNFTPDATVDAGPGVTVTIMNVSPGGTSMTGTFTIGGPGVAPTGNHFVSVTTPGGTTHNVVGFIVEAPPTLTGISPASGVQGTTGQLLTITGTNFDPGATVTFAGAGITVTSSSVSADQTTITITVDIAPGATLGPNNVSVTTNGVSLGASGNVKFTVNPPPPTLTSMNPTSGIQGSSIPVTFTGMNFTPDATVNFPTGSGLTLTNQTESADGKTISGTLNSPLNGPTGPQNISIKTAGGTTGNVTFTVNPAVPTLTSMAPTSGAQGSNFAVTFTGTNFTTGAKVNFPSGSGLTLGNKSVSADGKTISGTLFIASNAPTGAQNVSVTTAGGTTGNVTFTVNPATQTCTPTPPSFCGQFFIHLSGSKNTGGFGLGAIVDVDGKGHVTGGVLFLGGTSASVPLLPSTYSFDSNGDGLLPILTTQSGLNFNIAFRMDPLFNEGFAVEFDGTTTGIEASGEIIRDDGPFNEGQINGSYDISLDGSDTGGHRTAYLGVMKSTGLCDLNSPGSNVMVNNNGSFSSGLSFTGSCLGIDSKTGIGQATLNFSGGPFPKLNFTIFAIGTGGPVNKIILQGSDPQSASFPLLGGIAEAQVNHPSGFSNSDIGTASGSDVVVTWQGVLPSGHADVALAQGTGAPGGPLAVTILENAGGTYTATPPPGYSYSVSVGSTGIGTMTPPTTPTGLPIFHFVLTDTNKGTVLLEGPNVAAGRLTSGPTNTLPTGSLRLGQLFPPATMPQSNSVGVVTLSGTASGEFSISPTAIYYSSSAGGQVVYPNPTNPFLDFTLSLNSTTGIIQGGGVPNPPVPNFVGLPIKNGGMLLMDSTNDHDPVMWLLTLGIW